MPTPMRHQRIRSEAIGLQADEELACTPLRSPVVIFYFLPPVCGASRERLAVEAVSIECFRAEVQVRGRELFCLAQEKIASRLKIQMQPLQHSESLHAREMRQHVHAEDAIKAPDVCLLYTSRCV